MNTCSSTLRERLSSNSNEFSIENPPSVSNVPFLSWSILFPPVGLIFEEGDLEASNRCVELSSWGRSVSTLSDYYCISENLLILLKTGQQGSENLWTLQSHHQSVGSHFRPPRPLASNVPDEPSNPYPMPPSDLRSSGSIFALWWRDSLSRCKSPSGLG